MEIHGLRTFITSLLFKKEVGTSFKDLININIYPRRVFLKNYTDNFNDIEELVNIGCNSRRYK